MREADGLGRIEEALPDTSGQPAGAGLNRNAAAIAYVAFVTSGGWRLIAAIARA